jgi:hypothetical protein
MSVDVDVDLGSAVISYRPAAGKERCLPAERVLLAALFEATPWRTFRWYFGQRHYSGTWWSSTMRDHVIYESRLELSRLVLADFDPAVRRILAQPFMMTATVQGRARRHILDYLWDTADGPVVVDVVRAERLAHSDVDFLCGWTRAVVQSLGWDYRMLSEPAPVQDVEHPCALVDAVHRALVHAGTVLDVHARCSDHVCHAHNITPITTCRNSMCS